VHDTAMSPRAEAAYRVLARQGRLPISILGFPHSAEILTGPDQARWDGMTTGEGDAHFRVGPVKVFGDGAYPPACGGHVDGRPLVTGSIMPGVSDHVRTAIERGFGVAVHSLGNLALEAALGAWEDGTRHVEPSHRMRIEHVVLAGEQHAADMQRLGVAGVVQPGFIESTGDSTVDLRFEEHTWMPFAMLAARDVPLAASSDFPCSATSAPLALSRFGVSRRARAGAILDATQALPMNRWL
jgi:predicted amidohydrolase YtcJ